jgi:hypothetical protein
MKKELIMKCDFELYKKADGGLYLYRFGTEAEVLIFEAFPWSHPGQFLSLRNREGIELLFIESRNELSVEHRSLIDEALSFKGFVLEIIQIDEIEDEVELRRFQVTTQSGKRVFYTPLESWPEQRGDGSILILDIHGDIYQIKNWRELDRTSRDEISALVA